MSLRKKWLRKLILQICACLAGSLVILWSLWMTEVSLSSFGNAREGFGGFLEDLWPLDFSELSGVLESTFETLMIALAGTFAAVVFSIPLGFLAATNVSPAWIAQPIKIVLGFIRSIPIILVAVVFVRAFHLGPFPGFLAVAFHSTGMLAKFYAEEFETADKGILNAVRGTGATWIQTMRYGLFPQSVPQLVSFTVYRFEMNFRDASILGLVGAGGIGFYIEKYVKGYQYEKIGVLLLAIVSVVLLLDLLTFWVRKWVR